MLLNILIKNINSINWIEDWNLLLRYKLINKIIFFKNFTIKKIIIIDY